MQGRPRPELEAALAQALSRHVGYTTGAYEIDRIAEITLEFQNRPSLHQYELTRHLMIQSREGRQAIGEDYAAGILNFAVGLKVIHKVTGGSTPRVNRYAVTPEGATIRSALAHSEEQLAKFTLLGLVLESDSDAYALMLDILDKTHATGALLHSLFQDRFQDLRSDRESWLKLAFPNQILRKRIESRIPWIRESRTFTRRVEKLTSHFGRHHVTPRLGWAETFNHIKSASKGCQDSINLTRSGLELLRLLRSETPNYNWIGPPEGTQEALRIPDAQRRHGPFEPAWELLRPRQLTSSDWNVERVVSRVTEQLVTHYDSLKLVHANQVPIRSVLPLIFFEERTLGFRVPTDTVLETLFQYGSPFSALSTRYERYGYIQRRPSASSR